MAFPQGPPQTVDVQLVRAFKKQVVRPYRLLFNSLNASITDFTATLVKGKATTTALSNLVLRSFSLADWTATLGLDTAALSMLSKRLDARVEQHKAELLTILAGLRGIVRDLHTAFDAFREGVWENGILCDGRQREALSDMIMCERGSLTYRQVCNAVEGMIGMFEREVEEGKALVVDEFLDACERYRGLDDGRRSMEDARNARNTGHVSKFMEREYWEVRVLAWVTDVFLERDVVERNMVAMAADAGLPYFSSSQ